jgi:hypothetical protein
MKTLLLILSLALTAFAQPPMPVASAAAPETNAPHTLTLAWPATGETNRVMVDGVQQALAWTNATVLVAPGQRCLSIITLSGRNPYSLRGEVGWLPGEYRGVRFKVLTNGGWSAWQAWTNAPGTKLSQAAPPHLLEPHIEPPKQAWIQRPEFPLNP